MATLTADELASLRRDLMRKFRKHGQTIEFNKPDINATFQAIEDWIETHTGLWAAINTATSPTVISVPHKARAMQVYFAHKYAKGMD